MGRFKSATTLNLKAAHRVIIGDDAAQRDESKKMKHTKISTLNPKAARWIPSHGGAQLRRVDPLAGRVIDARQRFAEKREKECELPSADRHYIDSGTQSPIPGGRLRVCATFAKQPKDTIARSKNIMRREIINQGLMYVIVSLFVFLMMPLLRFVS